jgi:hypothetical protein
VKYHLLFEDRQRLFHLHAKPSEMVEHKERPRYRGPLPYYSKINARDEPLMELEGIRLLCGRGSFLFSEAKTLLLWKA